MGSQADILNAAELLRVRANDTPEHVRPLEVDVTASEAALLLKALHSIREAHARGHRFVSGVMPSDLVLVAYDGERFASELAVRQREASENVLRILGPIAHRLPSLLVADMARWPIEMIELYAAVVTKTYATFIDDAVLVKMAQDLNTAYGPTGLQVDTARIVCSLLP